MCWFKCCFCCSVTKSCLTLRPHGLQALGFPCPSPSPRACSNFCPLNWWWHPTISSSVIPFSCPQSFLASGSFTVCQLFTSGGQSVEVSALASVLPMNIQDWFTLGLTGLILLPCCPRDSQESSLAPPFESISSLVLRLLYGPSLTLIHYYWKNHSFD